MTITDLITLACFFFLIWRGYSRGFLASLLGPLALLIGSLVSIVYYAWTKNMIVSLCIGLFLPIVLAWIFRSSLHTWNKFSNADQKLNVLSRVSGALLSLIWGMAILIITVLLLAMMPPINQPLKMVFNDIHLSQLYHLIKPFDTSAIDKSTPQDNMKKLSEDKRIQDIINDPEVIDAVNRKDYASLINNPKITSLIKDPELLKRMLSIYKEMGQPELPQ